MISLHPHRHCERRSNPDYFRVGRLDCFAAFAMTECINHCPHGRSPLILTLSPQAGRGERESLTGTATSCSSRCRPAPSPNCPCRPPPA
ncbi:hypothetical protein DCG74_18420 [Bradyrhizobium sp. WBAH42]|nr:hypothetical protein [Bradyrhizobium sp. WBAH30]MDD1540915.1 hypothetical protein [Bradyrhizobium sp. WBAH41]MDD1557461.1 hypothetical protein [Bradyrhizobium sp. WBAH23]MDD1563550.1 hypothetical protein [Bradyrhizobium sp. WBAH33]MDD1590281.1 hypothetical protein [Bradyrhizobium sp. WBAH42]NRB86607.1 hypothetical protein [Bradyrhizobium sp. WBAH10]QCJ90337.1 hypothetical protein DAA57_18870 [Bradyrhizobium yuanmingense]